jgi:hypothetical protein
MAITALPTPPSRSDPANFADRGDAFLGALPTFQSEANALATDVTTKQGIASAAADTATTQAGIATTQAGIATTQVGLAEAQVDLAEAQVAIATTQAGNALTSANNAAASFDSFDDRYLGAKTSDPTLDNDGNALLTGALYFNSVAGEMRVYSGSAWLASYLPEASYVDLNSSQTLTNKTITKMVIIVSANANASKSNIHVFTASATLTLPATPNVGDYIEFKNSSGTTTPVIARNGENIMSLAEDLTLNDNNASGFLTYTDATRGWVLT